MSDYKGDVLDLKKQITYADGAVISKILLQKETGNITLFSFDKGQGFLTHFIHQQTCCDIGVIGLFFDQGPAAHYQSIADVSLINAIEQTIQDIFNDEIGVDPRKTFTGFCHNSTYTRFIQWCFLTICLFYSDLDRGCFLFN